MVATITPSLSARRAWIEISPRLASSAENVVALRKESVDRNVVMLLLLTSLTVALRKESVDRNLNMLFAILGTGVALRKESVDRNPCFYF